MPHPVISKVWHLWALVVERAIFYGAQGVV